ncbi:MAG: transposase [Actinobacteria bacterium]|nr:transposase [Actinomycetota bacterium]
MLTDRYDPVNIFELLLPEKLGLEMDPVMARLDSLLDDEVLLARIKEDLARRHPNSTTLGRRSTPVEVILRMLIVRRLYDLSYEQTERLVSDSLVLRQFCRVYLERVPDDTTLIRWTNLIGEETVRRVHESMSWPWRASTRSPAGASSGLMARSLRPTSPILPIVACYVMGCGYSGGWHARQSDT